LKQSYFKTNLFFVAIFLVATAYFLYWGADYTNHNHVLVFVLATFFGVFMAFNIGGNDVANSFGTSVGAGTLTIRQALIVAAIFEVSGAMIAGGEVTETIRDGIVDLGALHIEPMQFVYIMMASLLASSFWLLFATKNGYPVSTTHSIIGAIVGASITLGIVLQGVNSAFTLVHWNQIGSIALSWVVSPLLGGIASYLLYGYIKKHILSYNDEVEARLAEIQDAKKIHKLQYNQEFETLSVEEQLRCTNAIARDAQLIHYGDERDEDFESPYSKKIYEIEKQKDTIGTRKAIENFVPLVAAAGSMIIAGMMIFKGLKHMDLEFTLVNKFLIIFMVGALIWMSTFIMAKSLHRRSLSDTTFILFSWMQVFTASGFAFSHGSNDIANAIGPFAAIMDVLRTGELGSDAAVPPVAMLTFGVALISGLWFMGKEVIQTVGHNLTNLHPASGFSAELAAASVVLLASMLGIPVSSTHILIGAVLGIGLVNAQANWALMKPIALAWIITLPASAILSSIFFLVLSKLL